MHCRHTDRFNIVFLHEHSSYIPVVVEMNVQCVFYNGCSPRKRVLEKCVRIRVVFMNTWPSDAPKLVLAEDLFLHVAALVCIVHLYLVFNNSECIHNRSYIQLFGVLFGMACWLELILNERSKYFYVVMNVCNDIFAKHVCKEEYWRFKSVLSYFKSNILQCWFGEVRALE